MIKKSGLIKAADSSQVAPRINALQWYHIIEMMSHKRPIRDDDKC
jgi:hypothetical protein